MDSRCRRWWLVAVIVGSCGMAAKAPPPLAAGPAEVRAVLARGAALERQGKLAAALEAYRQHLGADPAAEVFRAAGTVAGKLKRYREGIELMERARAAHPRDPAFPALIGLLQMRSGDAAAARRGFEAALALEADHPLARQWLAKLEAAGSGRGAAGAGRGSGPAAGDGANDPDGVDLSLGGADGAAGDDGGVPRFTGQSRLSLEQQKKLARELYHTMAAASDRDYGVFDRLHRRVIEECPDTEQAEESCWRLSNLYLKRGLQPDYPAMAAVLEHFLARYPNSKGRHFARNRLICVYQQSGQPERLAKLLGDHLAANPKLPPAALANLGLEYADALIACGQRDQARQVLTDMIGRCGEVRNLALEIARARLASLQ